MTLDVAARVRAAEACRRRPASDELDVRVGKQADVNVVAHVGRRVDRRRLRLRPRPHEIRGKTRVLERAEWVGDDELAEVHADLGSAERRELRGPSSLPKYTY